MAFITSPTVVRVRDRNGTIIVPVARTLQFIGDVEVSVGASPSEAIINILGPVIDNNGNVIYGGRGSVIYGYVDAGTFETGGDGALAGGDVEGAASAIRALGPGTIATGHAQSGGIIRATGNASFAHGRAQNNAIIESTNISSLAFGLANSNGRISASGNGSLAMGNCDDNNSVIETLSSASMAFGIANSGGQLRAGVSNECGFAFGKVNGAGSLIFSNGNASYAMGFVQNGNTLRANADAAFAYGRCENFNIQADGEASFAFGYTQDGPVIAYSRGSWAIGDAVENEGQFSLAFGYGLSQNSYACVTFGRFNETDGAQNTAIWQDTDRLFVLGIGADGGNRRDGFAVYKDGRVKTVASHLDAAQILVDADATLSARTDRAIYADTAAAGGNINLQLPPGEDGLEFFANDFSGNAAINNVVWVPDGGDVIQAGANITTNGGYCHLQFFSGQWRILSATEAATIPAQAVEYITLDAGDIANQFITLAQTPIAGTVMFFAGKLAQFLGDDFSVTGAQLDFLGDLATGGIAELVAGDKVIASYSY